QVPTGDVLQDHPVVAAAGAEVTVEREGDVRAGPRGPARSRRHLFRDGVGREGRSQEVVFHHTVADARDLGRIAVAGGVRIGGGSGHAGAKPEAHTGRRRVRDAGIIGARLEVVVLIAGV